MYNNGIIENNVQQPMGIGMNGRADNGGKKKVVGVIVAIVVGLLVCAMVAMVAIMSNKDESEELDLDLVEERENTALLQLYSKIDSEFITLEELRRIVEESGSGAEIMADDSGSGRVVIRDSRDAILFYIDREDDNDEEEEEDSEYDIEELENLEELDEDFDGFVDDFSKVNVIDTYQPNDSVYAFSYAFDYDTDYGVGLYYSEDDDMYVAFNGIEDFAFPTKQEAIDAYLAPVVRNKQLDE